MFNARIALLGHDERSWRFNLQNASAYLSTYFSDYDGFFDVSTKLKELLKINVAMSDINIDNTLKALNKLKALEN